MRQALGSSAVKRVQGPQGRLFQLLRKGLALPQWVQVSTDRQGDDNYGCRALRNLLCTTQVRAGSHALSAVASDRRKASKDIVLKQGESLTWSVVEGDLR